MGGGACIYRSPELDDSGDPAKPSQTSFGQPNRVGRMIFLDFILGAWGVRPIANRHECKGDVI